MGNPILSGQNGELRIVRSGCETQINSKYLKISQIHRGHDGRDGGQGGGQAVRAENPAAKNFSSRIFSFQHFSFQLLPCLSRRRPAPLLLFPFSLSDDKLLCVRGQRKNADFSGFLQGLCL